MNVTTDTRVRPRSRYLVCRVREPDGKYRLELLEGHYALKVTLGGYVQQSDTLESGTGADADHDLHLIRIPENVIDGVIRMRIPQPAPARCEGYTDCLHLTGRAGTFFTPGIAMHRVTLFRVCD